MTFGEVWRLERVRPGGTHLVVVLQDDLHQALPTRVVAPLRSPSMLSRPVRGLHPVVMVEGGTWLVATHQLAALAVAEFDGLVADLSDERPALLAAIDLLVTGI